MALKSQLTKGILRQKGNVRELLALELFARGLRPLDPSRRLAQAVNQTCFRLFGLWGQVSSRAEQRQCRGAGESKRNNRRLDSIRFFPLVFSRASVLPLRGASRRPTGEAGRPGTVGYVIQSTRGSRSDRCPTQHRGLLLCSFLLRRKRVFPACFAEIRRFLSYFPICITALRNKIAETSDKTPGTR